ncbi:hypothetical protein OYC64_009117 [Pagothenia borchgrevinki]|uniref:FERM domain-containing protein n=1 Tax=Pagothenia borchgrevinki TaxID=8213 RepID=A0ABD2G819_PAGBO
MACFRGNREDFYGEVLLLDERKLCLTSEQGIKKSSKAAAILRLVFFHLKISQVEFFGLRFCDRNQQTNWLDPQKALSQHRDLVGPPYIFYFGVKFYAQDPSELEDEATLCQFYLQVRQDVHHGRLPCPPSLKPRLSALMLLVDGGERSDAEPTEEIKTLCETLSGVSGPQAQRHFLSLCSSLETFGVSLFPVYGEGGTEYFLGPTPAAVLVYRSRELLGKYLWQNISKLHFKDETFELRVAKNGSETSFFFHTLNRSDCKRLWRCCVEHHAFFRMSSLTFRLKHSSVSRSPALPRLNVGLLRNRTTRKHTNHRAGLTHRPIETQTAPPAVQRSEVGTQQEHLKPSAPWENRGPKSGLFNTQFPPNTNEEERGGPQRRSRSLDGDRPIRERGGRSCSHGNTSSGSESQQRTSEHHRRRRRRRTSRRSPDALTWKHIQKQLTEPDSLIDRQTEEIPYQEVRVLREPIRTRRSPRGAETSEVGVGFRPPFEDGSSSPCYQGDRHFLWITQKPLRQPSHLYHRLYM